MTTELLLMVGGQVLHAAVPPGEYVIGRRRGGRSSASMTRACRARMRGWWWKTTAITLEDLGSEHGTFIEEEPAVGASDPL